jgi:hypothetical protein
MDPPVHTAVAAEIAVAEDAAVVERLQVAVLPYRAAERLQEEDRVAAAAKQE